MDSNTDSDQPQQAENVIQTRANSLRSLLYSPPRRYNDSISQEYEQERPDILQCTLNSVYSQSLLDKCAYSDYACICMQLASIGTEPEIESCLETCPRNLDQRWTPGQILDMCDQIDTKPVLPDYMTIHAELHKRQVIQTSIITKTGTEAGPVTVVVTQTATGSDTQPTMTTTTSGATETSRTSPYTTAPTITTSETQTASPRTTAVTSDMSRAQDTSSGLSTGAKVGIGVAVPVIVILIIVLLWFLRRRRMRNKPLVGEPEVAECKDGMPPEIDGNPIHESGGRAIENSRSSPLGPVYELSGQSIVSPDKLGVLPTSEGTGSSVQDIRGAGSGLVGGVEVQPSGNDDAQHHDPADIRPLSSSAESGDRGSATQFESMDIVGLEEEIARVRKRKERLQYLQSLEEQEELLKQAIARKKGMGA
ncbi:hypothetical protein AFLA70_307g001821 [Aspergillus flavus AF70]|nr:hypothetical protein AFLA70_307g001821 [Aspergillus flavus AF70]